MATPYTTRDAVREILARDGGSATPGAGTAASLPDETIDSAILTASTKIDSRLGVVYVVPFQAPPGTPALVVDIAKALAAYDADLTFREVRDYQSELNPIYLRYREALDLLSQLQRGLATLPDYVPPDPDPGATDPPGGEIVAVVNQPLCPTDLYPNRYAGWGGPWNWEL